MDPDCDDENDCTIDVCNASGACEYTNNYDAGQTSCGFGECNHTINNCEGGVLQICDPMEGASPEVCDNLDNDCDNLTDEDTGGDPLTQVCYTGPNGTENVGICVGGTQTCSGGNYGTCEGEVTPEDEVCDDALLDEDCDGISNEDCGECIQGQTQECGIGDCAGIKICFSGSWGDCTSFNDFCDDGLYCTQTDICQDGECIGSGDPCTDDGNPCTDDSCNEGTNSCDHIPNDSLCDDSNICTDDFCDSLLGCQNDPNTNPCNDGFYCNGIDTCSGGTCSDHEGDPCPVGSTCTEALDICITSLEPPTGLVITYYGSTFVGLAWDENTGADLEGYKLYYGTSSGNYGSPIDVGDVLEYELSVLTEVVTYYVAVTA